MIWAALLVLTTSLAGMVWLACSAQSGAVVLAAVVLFPAVAHAQPVAGVVRDASGAVLPGVTVEASSPALIEKTRSAVTDGTGAYRIVDLRPGAYSVVFTLTGGPQIGPEFRVLFPDFLVFWAAAHAWIEGKLALIYQIDPFTEYQNALYPDRFPNVVHFRPFFYPPIWLLMLLPLGAIAVAKAYGLFMAGTMALATGLEGRRDWWGWLAVVTSPGAVWTRSEEHTSELQSH